MSLNFCKHHEHELVLPAYKKNNELSFINYYTFYLLLYLYSGRKRFVSEGDGGHIKPATLPMRD